MHTSSSSMANTMDYLRSSTTSDTGKTSIQKIFANWNSRRAVKGLRYIFLCLTFKEVPRPQPFLKEPCGR
jgi:hypothetical protein